MLCDDLGGWDEGGGVGGRPERVRTGVHIQLIRFVVQQTLIQHCKALLCQERSVWSRLWFFQ